MGSSEDITAELVQQMLREVNKDSTIIVLPSLVVEDLKEHHGGSYLCRVAAQYTQGGCQTQQTLSLIVKVIPKSTSLTEFILKTTMFPREIQMFDEILPRMSRLLSRAIPSRHTDFAAKAFYTRRSPSYVIAIEDLAEKGFKAPKRKDALDLEHCTLVFRTLARFHAASVMINLEDKSLFEVFDVYSFQEEALNRTSRDIARQLFSIVSRAVELWPEFGPSWAERLRKRYETLYEDLATVWTRDENAFNVLNHGDFGLHNVMFRHSESGEVEAVMLVDFQCCSYISPVLDLQQFLFSSATDEVRANHTNTLLMEYHAELTATLESLGASKEQTISLPQLFQDFNSKMLCSLLYAVCFLPFFCLDLDSGLTMEDFFNLDIEDSDKIQSLLSDPCVKSLKRLLPIFGQEMLL